MVRTTCGAVLVCLLALPALAPAQTYEIKIKRSATGDKGRTAKEETTNTKMILKGPDGKVLMENAEKGSESFTYVEEVLEQDKEMKSTRLRRAYEKAQVTKGDKTTTLPYQGKTVLIEKKGEKFAFSVDGKELAGEDAQALTKEFNEKKGDERDFEKILLPRKAVGINDTWQIDLAAFLKLFGDNEDFDVDAARSSGTGKLLRAYRKDGRQFGVVEITMDMPIKSFGKGDAKATLDPGAKFKITFVLDACIDGTASSGTMKATMEMTARGTFTAEGMKLAFTLDARNGATETHEELKK